MKPALLSRWIAALESGEYEQCPVVMRSRGAHSALGVLADLAVRDGVGIWGDNDCFVAKNGGATTVRFQRSDVLSDWLGCPSQGFDPPLNIGGTSRPVSEHSSHGVSFAAIAAALRGLSVREVRREGVKAPSRTWYGQPGWMALHMDPWMILDTAREQWNMLK